VAGYKIIVIDLQTGPPRVIDLKHLNNDKMRPMLVIDQFPGGVVTISSKTPTGTLHL
jgi:hypothetical protein